MTNTPACIILAAGKGTRMKSTQPKVMHKLAGYPLISHVVAVAELLECNPIIPVIAPDMDDVAQTTAPHACAIQAQQNGTGHAALCAKDALANHTGPVLILLGDAPFITPDTVSALVDACTRTGLSVLGFDAQDPTGYGRITKNGSIATAIIEDKDCDAAQRAITTCNAGAFCVDGTRLFGWLSRIGDDNAQGEVYLTDLVTIAANDDVACELVLCDEIEAFGINARAQLAQAEYVIQTDLRDYAMEDGVTLIDPDSVYFSADTQLGVDITIEPNVFIGPKVIIEDGATIHANSYLEGCVIRRNAEIGPFARIRPTSEIGEGASIGNFCEVNRSHVKAGAKSKHLSYLGDATIGQRANIGAGTVIANYDGQNKHKTHIGAGSFIGSNTTLIAPVTIGDGAYVGAGSTIPSDVPENALGVARARTRIIENWAVKRQKNHK